MNRKLALKRLTVSDLGLFKSHYDQNTQPDGTQKGGKQKSINLNVNPFTTRLYPALPSVTEIRVGLEIYGPGLVNKAHKVNRAIRKSAGSKNWRLNGEWVRDPDSADGFANRYHSLSEGDLIFMEFFGSHAEPEKIKILLISQADTEDHALFTSLDSFLGSRKMVALEDREFRGLASSLSGLSSYHPLQTFLFDETELEAAAIGAAVDFSLPAGDADSSADFNVTAPPSLRSVSPEALKKAKENAERNGESGEGFVNEFLENSDGYLESEWTSRLNAVSPYDFSVTRAGGDVQLIEVKSTSSSFGTKIHISLNEVRQAAASPGEYLIFRIYEMNEEGAKLRISSDIKAFAKMLLGGISGFPAGVMPDGFTLNLTALEEDLGFGEEVQLMVTEE